MLVEQTAALLQGFRALNRPVLHARSLIRRDGSNRMPHWRRADHWACVEGTLPPADLAPLAGERVFDKPFYSAFGHPGLADHLRKQAIDTLVIAGIYTHRCILASVLDAYQAGFEI